MVSVVTIADGGEHSGSDCTTPLILSVCPFSSIALRLAVRLTCSREEYCLTIAIADAFARPGERFTIESTLTGIR